MNFVVEPVLMPSVNWDSLRRIVNGSVDAGSAANINKRLRYIQDQNIGFCDPAALLIYLNGSQKAIQMLDIIELGFIFVIPNSLYIQFLLIRWPIKLFILGENPDSVTIFALGNCKDWVLQIEQACKEDARKDLRIIYNEVARCIERSRLNDFIRFNKKKLPDHTLEITCPLHG